MTESYGSIRLPRSFSLPSSLYQLSRIKLRNSFDGSQPVRRQTYNIDFNLTRGHISVHHERNIMLTVNHTGLPDSSLFPAYARPVPVVLSSPTFPPFPPEETASAVRTRRGRRRHPPAASLHLLLLPAAPVCDGAAIFVCFPTTAQYHSIPPACPQVSN